MHCGCESSLLFRFISSKHPLRSTLSYHYRHENYKKWLWRKFQFVRQNKWEQTLWLTVVDIPTVVVRCVCVLVLCYRLFASVLALARVKIQITIMERYTAKIFELIFHSIFLSHSSFGYYFIHILSHYYLRCHTFLHEAKQKCSNKNNTSRTDRTEDGKAILQIIHPCDAMRRIEQAE